MKKEHLKIDITELKANPKNPKQHDDKLIKSSIKDLGFIDDIVIDEKNVILSGHGRLKALQELGTKEVDVIRVSGWTQEQKDKYLLLSNKSVESGGWDMELLADMDKELLKQVGFDCDVIIKRWENYTGKKAKKIKL
jgi:ParB family transcriptional regulator, chromosome partitioning protein